MGRPAFVASAEQRKQVETMAGYGIPEDEIALVLGIDPKTLRKHSRIELDTASSTGLPSMNRPKPQPPVEAYFLRDGRTAEIVHDDNHRAK